MALIAAGIAVAVRLFYILGDVHNTIKGVDETRLEISATLKRVEAIVQTTDQVLREEITPTLRITRETLVHVESVTRALAETTQIIRRITGRAAPFAEAAPLVSAVATPVVEMVARQGGKLIAGFVHGLRGLFRRKKRPEPPEENSIKQIKSKGKP